MSAPSSIDTALAGLLDRMVAGRQLSSLDARHLARHFASKPATEDDILRWLANEYGGAVTTLDDIEPDRQLLSLFPARILLKEELLPLQRLNGTVEVATSRLFATQGLDALRPTWRRKACTGSFTSSLSGSDRGTTRIRSRMR